jgi:uncharacterized protein
MDRLFRGAWRAMCASTITLTLAAAGCGNGATTVASCPDPAAANKVTIDTGVKDKEPLTKPGLYEAIIYGTDQSGKATVLQLNQGEKLVTLDALFIRLGPSQATGGTSPVWITTEVQDERKVRVGMYEQYAGGMGPQWRAAVWIGSFVASGMLGKDLTDFRFTAESGGLIDGASAGALMTAGFLASMLGDEIDPTATMTGTVNPDGTVGPVGGIPQKFISAIEGGKKKLGYPVGLRYAVDINTGQNVDLEQLARDKGAEAVEIKDVSEAYKLMTGKELPEAVPVDRREMELEADVIQKLETYYAAWMEQLEGEYARLIELVRSGRLKGGAFQVAALAEEKALEAERLKNQGLTVSAYAQIVDAWIYAVTANRTVEVLEKVSGGDLSGAQGLLAELLEMENYVERVFREVGAMKPTNMGDHLRMIAGFENAITAWGFLSFGVDQLQYAHNMVGQLGRYGPADLANAGVQEEVSRNVVPAVLSFVRGVAWAKRALEAKEVDAKSINYMCSLPNARRLATSYASASGANLRYFESLVVADLAAQHQIPDALAQMLLKRQNSDYLIASNAWEMAESRAGLPQMLREEWGDKSLPWSLGTLAGSILSYFKTSMLISMEYSLGVQYDYYTGQPTGVQFEKAFKEMLIGAEVKARQNAHAAKIAAGSIPVEAKLSYQLASLLREGSIADKLRALEMFWESSVFSQTAVMLARN